MSGPVARHPLRWLRELVWRVHILVTRRTRWVNPENPGDVEVHRETLFSAWQLVKPRTWDWWWVRRWGDMPCGCTRNPLTRRVMIFALRCEVHGIAWHVDDDDDDEEG